MKRYMEMEEIELALEKILDLHEKISDAIHVVSRAHLVHTVNSLAKSGTRAVVEGADSPGGGKRGFVFAKGFRSETDICAALAEEARSLDAIRASLENLEDQLEFFHTLQSELQAERAAALTQLEQSRIVLATRLSDHQGKNYKVIEEALAFVGNVHDGDNFIEPETLYEMPRSQCGEILGDQEDKRSGIFMQMVVSSFSLAKRFLGLENIGGVLGNAVLFAASMIAFMQFQQLTFKGRTPVILDKLSNTRSKGSSLFSDISFQNPEMKDLDVFSARG